MSLVERFRFGRRPIARRHLAVPADQEFGEIPLDRSGAEQARFSPVRCLNSGCAFGPLTSTFANIGNVTP